MALMSEGNRETEMMARDAARRSLESLGAYGGAGGPITGRMSPPGPMGGLPSPPPASLKGQPVAPVTPRPVEQISMNQLSSVPDYVAKFLVDLSRKVLGLPEGTSSMPEGLPTPSHGYRVAEGGMPEVVNAEGAYYPFERGQVTPLIPRQYGGVVKPPMRGGLSQGDLLWEQKMGRGANPIGSPGGPADLWEYKMGRFGSPSPAGSMNQLDTGTTSLPTVSEPWRIPSLGAVGSEDLWAQKGGARTGEELWRKKQMESGTYSPGTNIPLEPRQEGGEVMPAFQERIKDWPTRSQTATPILPLGPISEGIGRWWEKSKQSLADPGGWLKEQAKQLTKWPERIDMGPIQLTRRGLESAEGLPSPPTAFQPPATYQAEAGPPPIDMSRGPGDTYEALPSPSQGRYRIGEGTWTEMPEDYWKTSRGPGSLNIVPGSAAGPAWSRLPTPEQQELAARERWASPEYANFEDRGRMIPGYERSYYEAHPEERAMDLEMQRLGTLATMDKTGRTLAAAVGAPGYPKMYEAGLQYGPGSPQARERSAHADYLAAMAASEPAYRKAQIDKFNAETGRKSLISGPWGIFDQDTMTYHPAPVVDKTSYFQKMMEDVEKTGKTLMVPTPEAMLSVYRNAYKAYQGKLTPEERASLPDEWKEEDMVRLYLKGQPYDVPRSKIAIAKRKYPDLKEKP